MANNYTESLPADAKGRYLAKIGLVGLSECPYKLPHGAWKNDPTEWPAVEYPQVYNYLIESPGK